MIIFGKIVGAAIGGLLGGPIGAVIGAVLGHIATDSNSYPDYPDYPRYVKNPKSANFTGLHENGAHYKNGICLEDFEEPEVSEYYFEGQEPDNDY